MDNQGEVPLKDKSEVIYIYQPHCGAINYIFKNSGSTIFLFLCDVLRTYFLHRCSVFFLVSF